MAKIREWQTGAEFKHASSPVTVTVFKPSDIAPRALVSWPTCMPASAEQARGFSWTLQEAVLYAEKLDRAAKSVAREEQRRQAALAAHRPPSTAEIDAARTVRGGWTRKTLAGWGVGWPPPKGWRAALIAEHKRSNPQQ